MGYNAYIKSNFYKYHQAWAKWLIIILAKTLLQNFLFHVIHNLIIISKCRELNWIEECLSFQHHQNIYALIVWEVWLTLAKKAFSKISKGLLSMHFFPIYPPTEEGLGK